MRNFKQSQSILFIYSSFVAFGAAWVLRGVLSSPSEAERAVLFGLSIPRLIIAFGLLTTFVLLAWLAFKALTAQTWAEQFVERWFREKGRSQWTGWVSGTSFGLAWIGCFLPAYRLGVWSNYWERIQPLMAFALLASLATLLVLFIEQIKSLDLTSLISGLPIFVICLLVLGIMLYSRFGVTGPGEDYWYGAGVPILSSQLVTAILAGILLLRFGSTWTTRRADILICISIYAITAFVWARSPLHKSFLFTEPSLPSYVFYPFADSANFDMASQFALIGQKLFIFNTLFFERPLYLSFLIYLHSLFGQSYELLMAIQAGVFAIFPVLIYLIGRELQVRSIGLAAAVVVLFRGVNSISASNLMDTANPKMILTDFPTAIGVAFVTLMLCRWLGNREKRYHHALWVGGAIGFTLMLRTNALILLALIPVVSLFMFAPRWREWFLSSCLILLGVVSITLPWEIRNQALGGQMYGPLVAKFRNVIQQRYPWSPVPSDPSLQQNGFASFNTKSTAVIASLYQADATQNSLGCSAVLCFSTSHFLHNTLTSLLVLPTSPFLDDLRQLIRERHPYWQASWDGTFDRIALFFLVLNLFLISLGIARAWKEARLQGLMPLVIFIAYNISNALARTSGGRYLVPTDWFLIFYYLWGVFHIIAWVANNLGMKWNIFATAEAKTPGRGEARSKALGTFTVFLLFGALLPLSEILYLPRYQNIDPQERLASSKALIEQTGLKLDELDAFVQNPHASIVIGRALYPRFYKMDQGEFQGAFYPYQTLEFPRTAFKLIGPGGEHSIILPGHDPVSLPHTSDVLVVGCQRLDYFDALLVIVLGNNGAVYERVPKAPLACPLQQPVCSNNSVCQ